MVRKAVGISMWSSGDGQRGRGSCSRGLSRAAAQKGTDVEERGRGKV